ncbi:MAG TPA: hypothetical protein EYQ00_15435 [Dehalococcoidia bacterium]|nr:hypothetical protein [Dehalococcoidia bacterium]
MLTHIKDNRNHWTVVVDNQSHQFDHTHPEYEGLVECVKTGDAEAFAELLEIGTVIENWSEGNFEFRDGFLYYEDEQVASQPTDRIIQLIKNGWDKMPMLAYLDRLYQNISNRAVMESYDWCSHRGLPITPDGYLVGYKGVGVYNGKDKTDKMGRPLSTGDLVDKWSNSIRNNIADEVSMNRRKVSDNCNEGCSAGLHVGTYEYACGWAGSEGKVVLVRFDPSDIVSVPTDCEYQKMRVSRYTVIGVARDIIEEEVYDDTYSDEIGFVGDDNYDYGIDF